MINLILKTVAVGTGVATVVLSLMGAISAKDASILLGLGVSCLAINELNRDRRSKGEE